MCEYLKEIANKTGAKNGEMEFIKRKKREKSFHFSSPNKRASLKIKKNRSNGHFGAETLGRFRQIASRRVKK